MTTLTALYAKMNELKDEILAEITSEVKSIPDVTVEGRKDGGLRFFTLKMSTIRENNYILSPDYYDIAGQLNKLTTEINKRDLSSAVSFLNRTVKTGKIEQNLLYGEVREKIKKVLIEADAYVDI